MYFIHRYDQKSKDYVLPLSDIWEMRPGGAKTDSRLDCLHLRDKISHDGLADLL